MHTISWGDYHNKIGNAYSEAIDEIMERYGLNAGSDKLIAREEGFEMGLKPQYQELIKHALIVKLHDRKVIEHPDVTFSRELLRLESNMVRLDDSYTNVMKVNVCDEACWKTIQSSPYKSQFHDYLLKYNFVLEEEILHAWREEVPEDMQGFIYQYMLQHADKGFILAYLQNNVTTTENIQQLEVDACRIKNLDTLGILIKMGIVSDSFFKKTLLLAVSHNKPLLLEKILTSDQAKNFSKGHLGEALVRASEHGHTALVETILNSELAKNIPIKNYIYGLESALNKASQNGHMSVVDKLLNSFVIDKITDKTLYHNIPSILNNVKKLDNHNVLKNTLPMHLVNLIAQRTHFLDHQWNGSPETDKTRNGIFYENQTGNLHYFEDGKSKKTIPLIDLLPEESQRAAFKNRIKQNNPSSIFDKSSTTPLNSNSKIKK